MKKFLLALAVAIAFMGGFAAGDETKPFSDNLESASLYEIFQKFWASQNGMGQGGGLPAQLSFLTSAKINIHAGEETVGIVLEGGKISAVIEGGLDGPSMEFKTSRRYFNTVITSNRPIKRIIFGLKKGFIVRYSRDDRHQNSPSPKSRKQYHLWLQQAFVIVHQHTKS